MGRGKLLSATEKDVALNLHKKGMKISEIAENLNRSRKVIYNLLKDPKNYGTNRNGGRPRMISERQKRIILREASNSHLTARKIAEKVGISTNVRNVQRVLKQCEHIKRKKLKRKPPLTTKHKQARMKFAEDHLKWKKRWRQVLFSDEKKFNLDGPDGWSYYFHDLRKKEEISRCRQHGGGSVMIWAAIGYKGVSEIKFVPPKMKSLDYVNLVGNEVAFRGHNLTEGGMIFQQDNAAVHTAKGVKNFFNEKNIEVLEWPARSPDLNIIENCWGHLAREVYCGNR